jgi:NhaP-type Na+/H+ or K+/H+ antiporter
MRHDEDPMEGFAEWVEIALLAIGVVFLTSICVGCILYALTT